MYLTKRSHKELAGSAAGDLAALSSSVLRNSQAAVPPVPSPE